MDPDDPRRFAGQPWEVWAKHLGRWGPIPDPPVEKRERGVTLLPREDMGLYGFCPEWDPFYTVVCEQCQKVVKPQGLSRHYDLWHPDFKIRKEVTLHVPSAEEPTNPPENKSEVVVEPTIMIVENKVEKWSPLPSTSSSSSACHANETSYVIPEQQSDSQETNHASEGVDEEDDCIILDSPKTSPVTSPKELSVMEPFVVMTRLPSPSKLPNYVAKFAAQSKSTHRASAQSSKKRFKTEKRSLPVKERQYDPDRHCGVWIEEHKRACTRSLTCKSHALSLRRAVIGRSMSFDKLLAKHRAAKESKLSKQPQQARAAEVGTNSLGRTSQVQMKAVSDETSGVDNGAMRLTSFSPCDPSPVLQTTAAKSAVRRPVPSLPDLTIDTFDKPIPSGHSLLTTVVARFTPEQNHSPRPPEENILRVSAKLDDLTFQKIHPKPQVVPGLIARKCGGISWSGRRIGLFRHGLQTALTQGYIRIPLSNDYYGVPLQYPTNHATSTMKTVLTNISTKGNMLSVSNKLLGPNCTSKSLQVTTNSSRKLNQIHSPLSATIMNSGSLKTVLPKPSVLATKSVNNSTNTTELSVKNGQFHVPNILSASLKRPLETVKSNAGVCVKRNKRKNCVNPNEVLSSLLARKNHISSPSNNVPLVTMALSNGVTVGNSGSSQVEGSETKTIFTSQSVVVPEGLLSELPKAITSNSVATLPESASGNTAVKGQTASQTTQVPNLRIAAGRGTLQLASPQFTYLTTGPVTFQQIPVLSSQVISQIQLQSKNNSSPSSIPLKILSQSSGIEFSSPHSVVVHSDLEQASTET
ncbi:ataxin-7-like protein 1 isoform X2 [Anabrus simplex]|uniref:ataxin-7-like protein 1 isoform X2 n=1 Tax=Anabrus simplex TaxID=316456 RepID=UPI0035A3D05B